MMTSLHTMRPDLLVSDAEMEIIAKLLPLLRRPAPRNGAPDIIIIARTQYHCTVSDTNKRGKIDLTR